MNRSTARARLEGATSTLFVRGDIGAVSKYFTADYVAHVTEQSIHGGHALVRSVVELYREAFPDLSVEVTILLESPAVVAWQRTMRGTHTNPFKGFPGTGHPVVWREMVVSRFSGPLIAEEWVVTELAERLLLARKAISRKQPPKPQRPRRSEA